MARVVATLATAALVAVTWARLAAADPARAEESFQAGRALLNEGRYAEACPKFEQSQREDPASGTLLALAYCEELAGRLASAYRHYKAAAELAEREGHDERHKAAVDKVTTLGERVSILNLVVPPDLSSLDGLKVVRNGVELERALLGTDMPVDGGTYKVEASAPGRTTWSATVTLETANDKKTLIIQLLEPLAPSEALEPQSEVASPPATQPRALPAPAPQADGGSRTLEHTSIALAIGSVASFSIGIAFGLMAASDNDASNEGGHCDSRGCDPRGMELRNDAISSARVATWSFVAGGALALGSVGFYIGAKNSGAQRTVAAGAIPGGAGIVLTEAF